MKKQDEGFTLIELLIVIVILGILAAVVVFAVSGIADRGTVSACKADRATVEVAQEAHYAQTTPPVYAASTDALATAGFLRSASTKHTTDTSGDVTGISGECP